MKLCRQQCAVLMSVLSFDVLAECKADLASNIEADRYEWVDNNTVKDVSTGLVWLRCPLGFVWSAATASCDEVPNAVTTFSWSEALAAGTARGDGWRLPNSKELESLVKRSCDNPAIDTTVFSPLSLGFFWSSTSASAYFGNAWAVQFQDGGVVSVAKENAYKVRLVKDAL
jgi:Protein of unknown function (DUF1566)